MENIFSALPQTFTESLDIIHAAFLTYLKNSSDMIFIKDINHTYQAASLPFAQMAGKQTVEEIIGRTDFEIFENPELAKRYTTDDRKLLAGGKDLVNYVEPLTDDNGLARYSSTSKYILRDRSGKPIGILGISIDITREYMARRRHQQELQYLFELPEDTFAALFMDIDDWRIIRHHHHTVGDQIIDIYETMDSFIENALTCMADPSDTKTREFYSTLSRQSMLELCNQGARNYKLEYLRHMPNGTDLWVRTDIHFLVDPESGHLCAIWTIRDINNKIQESMYLHQAAERDDLTGLLNRASTTKQINETLASSPQDQHALFIIDIDNFKSINDTNGHQAGDKLLTSLAASIKSCFRDGDIVGRIGGDEFFVLMKNIPSSQIAYKKALTLQQVSRLIFDDYPELPLSISIGIGTYPLNGTTLDQLYTNADHALYEAKRNGKNCIVFADNSII